MLGTQKSEILILLCENMSYWLQTVFFMCNLKKSEYPILCTYTVLMKNKKPWIIKVTGLVGRMSETDADFYATEL